MPSRHTPRASKATPLSAQFLRRLSSWLVLSTTLTLAAAKVAHAGTTIYWDADGSAANNVVLGTGLGGSGLWNSANQLWWNGSSGSDQSWVNANLDDAVFGGTAGVVSVASSITADSLTFNTTGYTFTGAPVTLAGAASINVANGATATINSALAGTSGVTVNGPGTLVLSGFNTFSGGLAIQSGTVTLASNGVLEPGNSITLGNTSGSAPATLLVSFNGAPFLIDPIVLAAGGTGALTVGNTGTSISATFATGVTGANNFTISENATTGSISFTGNAVNNAGTVTNVGAGTGTTSITQIGSNVTGVIENSATSPLTIGSGTAGLIVNSAGTTLTNDAASGTAAILTVASNGVTGTGNLILSNNNSTITNGIQLTGQVGNTGMIINQGIGTSAVLINGTITPSVTGILQNSPTSQLTLAAQNSSGSLTIQAGVVQDAVGTVNALGNGSIQLGNTAGNTAVLTFNGTAAFPTFFNAINVGGGSTATDVISATSWNPVFADPVTLQNTNLTIGSSNNSGSLLTFTGGITGTGNVTVSMNASTGHVNDFVSIAGLTINGTITFNNASYAGPGGSTTGGASNTGTNTISKSVGSGVSAITNASNTNPLTISGNITPNSAGTTLNNNSSTLFTVTGNASGPGNLIFNANGTGNFSVTLGSIGNTGTITNSGSGAGTTTIATITAPVTGIVENSATSGLSINNASAFTGTTTVNAGTLTLTGTVGSTATLAMGGGTFLYNNATQTMGAVTVNPGFSVINASSATLTLGTVTENPSGLLDFNSSTTGTIKIANSVDTTGIIGTWAAFGSGTALSYVMGGGGAAVAAYNSATPDTGNLASLTNASTNYSYNTAATVSGSPVGNTLRYTGGATITALGTSSLTLNGLMNAGTALLTISGNAGSPGLVIGTNPNSELDIISNAQGITISSVISGSGNLVYASFGGGVLTLSGTDTYNGALTVDSGIVTITGTQAANALNLNAGTVNLGVAAALGTSPITLGNSGNAVTLNATVSGATFANPLLLAMGNASAATIGNSGTAISTTFSGGVTGSGNLVISSAATTGTVAFSTAAINNTGTVTNTGAGTGTTTISGGIGSNVMAVTEASNASPLTVSGGLAVNSAGTTLSATGTALFTVSGGITGTGNLVVSNTTATASGLTISGTAVNNTGTITNIGASTGGTLISAPIGANVISLTQAGASPFTISSPFVLSATNNTLISTGTGLWTFSGGLTGAQNLNLDANFTGGITISTAAVNNTGTITNSGFGTGTITLSGGVGSNVTQVTESSNTSPLTISGPLTVNSISTTLTNSAATAVLTISGGVTGIGNLILNTNNVTLANVITISGAAVNNTGTITNSGTGAGTTTISALIGAIASGNVTQIIESSVTSALTASGGLDVAAGGTTLTNSATSGSTAILNVSGATAGTGNLILNNNSAIGTTIFTAGAVSGGITLGAINNIGTITNSGTGTGPVYITGAIGTAVTAINQNSTTSPLVITGGTAGTTTGTVTIAPNTTVQLGNQSANNLALGAGAIADNGTLIFAPALTNTLAYANAINGSGNVTLNGLAGSGANAPSGIILSGTTGTFSGTYTLNQGRFSLSAASNLGSPSSITINGNSGNLTGGQIFVTTAITLATPVTINGYGPTENAGNLGALRLSTANDIWSGPITLGSNASISTQNVASTVSGVISGGANAQLLIGTPFTGTDNGNFGGTLALSNTNTYSGGTLIQGMTAALGAVGALGTGPVIVSTSSNSVLTESVANALTGANSLTVNGGTATLSQLNNYTGATTIAGGTLTASVFGAVPGTTTVNMTSGTLNNNAASGILPSIFMSGGAFAQTAALVTSQSFNISGGTATFSQANTYFGGTTLSGAGTLNVTAASGLPGAVAMTGGTLISSVITGAANTGIVTQSGGLLTSAVAGGQFGVVNASSGAVINPGGQGVIGTGPLTVANLTTASGATLQFDLLTPWSGTPATTGDLLNLSGAASIASGTNIGLVDLGQLPIAAGDYRLIGYSGTAPTLGSFVLPSAPTGVTYSLDASADPGFIDLVVSGSYAAITGTWNQAAAGTFSWNTAANWSGNVIPQLTGDTANFGALSGSETVTLDGSQHAGTLNLNPGGSTNVYTFGAGSNGVLLLDNGASDAQVTNTSGNNVINDPVTLISGNSNFNIAGGTTLTISGLITGTGGITLASGATSGGSLNLSTTGTSTFADLNVNSGTVIFTTAGQLGSGPITLNGGALTSNAAGSVTFANSSLTVLSGGGTLTDTGAYTAKLFFNSGTLQGSGTLTKLGTGDLQATTPQPGFSGNWILTGGTIESQANAALGSGSVTINTGTDLDISVLAGYNTNAIILNAGGQFSAEAGNIAYGGAINVTGAANIGLRNNYATNSAGWNLSLGGALSGSGNLTLAGSTTTTTVGMFTPAGDTSTYTGTAITVAAQTALGLAENGGTTPASGAIGTTPNALIITVQSGGYLGLVADGDGSSSIQTITYTPDFATTSTVGLNTVVFSTGNGGYIVGRSGATGIFNQAANKIILFNGTLPTNAANAYTVTPENGYGLELDPVLTATTTYTVNGTQASNVVPGLILTDLTGGFGIIKAGTGTLQLGTSATDASNTFGTGTASAITVNAGTVSAFADQNLGAAGNGITLSTGEFLALNSFTTGRTITISSTSGGTIGVASQPNNAGSYILTLNTGLAFSAVGTLTKVDDGTLVPTAAVTGTATGGTAINAGAIQIAASNRIGSGTITLANTLGAALQLTGAATYTQALSLSSFGIQGNGALESVTGTNIYTGNIAVANAAAIGVDSGSTLTISTGTWSGTAALALVGGGTGTISNALPASGITVFAPGGTWNLTAADTVITSLTIDAGTLKFSGAGTNGNSAVAVNYGSVLTLDDTGTNVASRLAGHSIGLTNGTLNLLGSGTATTTETTSNALTFNRGEDVINVTAGSGQQANLTFGSLAHAAATSLSSVEFEGSNLGSPAGLGVATIVSTGAITGFFQGAGVVAGASGAPVINHAIIPWALADNTTGGNITFATSDTGGASQIIRPLNAFESVPTLGAIGSASFGGATVTTQGTTTVLDTNTTGLVIGQTVYGPGIPAGATITAISANTSFTISQAATNSASETVSFLSTGAVGATGFAIGAANITATSAVTPSASLPSNTLSVNSLTLGTSGSLTLNNSPQTLVIGGTPGGGILALDTISGNTISGGLIGTGSLGFASITQNSATVTMVSTAGLYVGEGVSGTNIPAGDTISSITNGTTFVLASIVPNTSGFTGTFAYLFGNGELDVHTVGNLTIGSNLIGGGSGANPGLTKGETGTLTLTGTAFYGGQTVINAGTLSLSGPNTANTIQYTNYLELGAGATLNLNGNTQIVTDLYNDAANTGTGLGEAGNNAIVTGTTGSMIILDEDSARTFTGSIQGAASFVHSATSGSAVSLLTQKSTYTGVTMILGGGVTLNGAGQLSSTTGLTINQASLTLDNNTGSEDLPNRIPVGLAISLNGGTINYTGRTQYLSAENIGAVTAFGGANVINATVQTTGVASADLTLAGLTRDLGATVNFTSTLGILGTIGTNPAILITGQSATGSTGANSILGGGFIVSGTDFAAYNTSFGVGALSTTGFAGYSPDLITSPSAGDNILLAFNPGANLGATNINSLKIAGSGAITIPFAAGGGLNLASGGLLTNNGANAVTLGTTANNGTLTTSGPELFLYNNGTVATTINSVITGSSVALVKSGSGPATIAGTNTYQGGTYVDQGTLTLGNSGNVTIGQSTLGTGGIFLDGGTLTQTAGGVIPTQAVTIYGSGVLTLNANDQVAGTVTTAGSNTLSVPNVSGIAVGQLVTGTGIPAGEFVTGVNPATNTVTITTGTGVAAGSNTITFLVNNTLSSLTFDNTGGTAAPTVTANTLLTLTGSISASSINVGDTSLLAGVVSLNNQASPTISITPINPNGQNIAPLAPTLNISAALQNESNAITVSGGGVLELSGASNFTGGVKLSSGTSLLIGASSSGAGSSLTGPLGNGTFTIGSGSSVLIPTANITVNNNISIAGASAGAGGNVTFDIDENVGVSTPEILTIGTIGAGGIGAITLPNGTGTGAGVANTTLNVNAPQMTVALSGSVSGTFAAITKTGLGNLILNGNNTFDSGVTINNGNVTATSLTGLGTGPVTLNGGQLSLHLNGGSSGGIVALNNDVNINTNLASAFIDVNSNGGTFTGNTILMGALNYTGYTGATAPTTVLNITGGNSYGLRFQTTNLSTFTAPVDVSVASGLTLILPGSGFTLTNAPVNVGPGTLILSGSSINSTPFTVTGTQLIQPTANGTGYQFNTTGAIALGAGSTLQVVPVVNTSTNPLTNTGYTSGGLQGKYDNFTGTTNAIISAAASSIPGAAVLPGQASSDSSFSVRPNGTVTAATFADSMAFYNGLLHITTGGTYTFQSGADDGMQLVIDGVTVFQQLDSSTAGQALSVGTPVTVNLSAGYHQITLKALNLGSGGGVFLLYGGPDTASNGLQQTGGGAPPLQAIALTNLYYQNAPSTAAYASSGYGNAAQVSNALTLANGLSATIDGQGSDLNSLFASLTLNGASALGGSVLTINNVGGQGTIGILGTTTITAANQEVSTNTGTLYLIGGVTDGVAGNGLTKVGAGTLILGASAGTFTGPLNINNGFLQVADPAALTTGTTTIASGAVLDLNGVSNVAGTIMLSGTGNGSGTGNNKFATANSTGALMNSNAVAASTSSTSTVTIGAAGTFIGGYGNINLQGTFNDTGLAWSKVGPGMLTLSGVNALTGVGTISGGILQVGNAGALGTGAGGITVSSGAALDLNGIDLADGTRAITISGTGIANAGGVSVSGGYGTYNTTLAVLFNGNASAPASISGPVALAAAASVGSNVIAGNTASSKVPVSATTPGNGDVSLAGIVSGAFVLTKVGYNNLFLTNGANTLNNFQVNEGTVVLNGAGLLTAAAASSALTVSAGGSLILDNVGMATNNRVGTRGIFLDGDLTILGNNTTAVTETISPAASGNNINAANSQGIVTLDAQSGAALTLAFAGTAQPFTGTNGTLEVMGTQLGTASAAGVAAVANTLTNFTGTGQAGATGTPNQAMNPITIAINSTTGAAGFASFSNNTASATSILQPLTVAGGAATLTATDNVFASSGLTAPTTGITSINSLTLLSGGGLTIGATSGYGNTISIQSGGLLLGNSTTTTGLSDTIGGAGTLTTSGLTTAFYVHVLGGDTLTVASNVYLAGGTGLIKGDGGTLVLDGNLVSGVPTYNGLALPSAVNVPAVYVNSGTLELAGGTQTLFQAFEVPASPGNTGLTTTQALVTQVQFGATLDLNGTSQVLQALSEANTTDMTGGSIINSNATTAATLRIAPNGNLTWSGNISGAGAGTLNFVRSGNSTYQINSPQTYTGTSTFEGGVTDLIDLGALSGTSQIDIVRGVLRWDNTGYTALGNRLTNAGNSTLPTMYLDGGAFEFTSRAGAADTANIGNVVLNSGGSLIQVQTNGGNATLNVGTLTRNIGTDITFSQTLAATISANLGSFGANPNLYFSTAPTLSNGIIGGWAVVLGEDIGQGGTIAQASFATYDATAGLHGMDSLNETTAGNAGNTFGSGLNTRLTASQTLLGTNGVIATTTTNSLTMSGAITLSYVNPGDTLAVQSGGVLSGLDANARAIGQSQGFGNLTTGTGQQELFLHSGTATGNGLTINANIINNAGVVALNLDGLNVTGTMITLAGNDTYTGTTYVNGVIVNLSSLNANGGTAISGTNVIVSGSTSNGSDSAAPNNAALVLQANNQINSAANVTLLGGSELNTNGFNTTINNLTITNDGGDGGTTSGPAVLTYGTNATTTTGVVGTQGGAGVLTLTGTLSATTVGVSNINSLSNVANAFTIPVINGQIDFTSATPTIYVDPTNVPGQVGLEFNGIPITNSNSTVALSKTGNGVLGIGGLQTAFDGAINVTAGTLAFGATGLVWGGSQVNLSSGTVLDTRGLTGTIGSLTGSGTVENYALATAGTLQTGLDNSNTTFSGVFASPLSSSALSVIKVGTGTFTLTGASTATNNGTLTVEGGVVDVNGTGQVSFAAETLNSGGTLLLDNTASVLSNRLGTGFEFVSQAVATATTTARTLNFAGGQLTIEGGSSAVSESLGNITITGGGILNLGAAGTGGVNVTIGSIPNQGQNTSLLIMGDGLGTATGANVATLNATTITWRGGTTNTPGSTTLRIREDIVVDTSSTDTTFTGTGVGFLTADTTTNLLRPLNQATELLGSFTGVTATTNVGLGSLAAGTVSASVNPGTLTLESAGGGVKSGIVAGNPWSASGGLLNLTLAQGGTLAQPGNTGISFGELTNGDTADIHVLGAGVLNLNAALVSTNGLIKADSGTLVLQQAFVNNVATAQSFAINGGTVRLAAGNNTLWTQVTATIPTGLTLNIVNGTLDLDGNSQLVGQITNSNPLPYAGGTAASPNVIIDNTSSTAANFVSSSATANTFSGVLQNSGGGALSFYRFGAGGLTLTSPSTYTGSSNFTGGNVVLQSLGSIADTSAVNLNNGTLVLDNTALEAVSNRLGTAPVNLSGNAGLTFNGREGVDNMTLGPVNILTGDSTITETNYNSNNQTGVLNVTASSLSQSGGGTVNFVSSAGTFGAVGGTSHFFLGNAPVLANGIIGGWAVVNGADFAGYTATQGVGAFGTAGFPVYSSDALTAGVAADNIQIANTGATTTSPFVGTTTRTINSLRIATNFGTQITLNSLADQLTIQTGGLLQGSNQSVSISSGKLTAGTTSSAASLYAYINAGTTTINSQIVDNSIGGSVTLVKSGGGTLALTPVETDNAAAITATASTQTLTLGSTSGLPASGTVTGGGLPAGATYTVLSGTTISVTYSGTPAAATNQLLTFNSGATLLNNTFSGGLIVDQGTVNLAGAAGTLVIPGNVTVNGGATLTETTNAGQIATTSNITLNNNFTFNLPTAANTFNSLTFNDGGSSTSPTLTIPTGTALTLSGASVSAVITANSSNSGTIPTIAAGGAGSTLALPASPTITTGGIAMESLVLNAVTTVASGGLTINGTGGGIVLGATEAGSTFAGGVTLTGQSGLIFTTGSTGTPVTAGPLGTGTFTLGGTGSGPTIQTAGAAETIANAVAINGNFTYGGSIAADEVTLSGAVTISNSPTITVTGNIITETITGAIGGSGGFAKAGPGALTLTPASASTFTGPISLTGGLLTMGNINAFGAAGNAGADYNVGATAEINVNNFALSIGSLAGGGIVTNSGATAGTLLTIGAGSDATNATFSGALTAATVANLAVTKTGTNNQTLSGQSFYTGATTVNGGTLTLANGSTAATTPTLANTAITVAPGQTLAISTLGANAGTNNIVGIGNTITTAAGASLVLSAGSDFTFNPADTALSTFNIVQGSTAGTGFTTSSATTNLTFNIGNTGADEIFVTKAAAATGGTIDLNVLSGATGIPLGVIPLITAGSGFSGSGSNNFTLANSTITIGAKTYTLTLAGAQDTTTQTALLVTIAAPTNAYWSGAVNGIWNTINSGVTNWRTDATSNIDTQAIPTSATNVFFYTTTPAAAFLTTNNLGAPFSIASLNFTAAATGDVNIGDGGNNANTLTIGAGGITLNNNAGNDSVNANVVLGASQTWTNNSTGANALSVNGSATAPSITGSGLNLNVAGAGKTTIAAAIQTGTGGVTMSGTGTLVLSGANTYSGTTTVSSGTVVVSGSLSGSVHVTSAGTLASGNNQTSQIASLTVDSDATPGGVVAPGGTTTSGTNGVGVLNVAGNVTLGATGSAGVAHLSIELGGTTAGTTYDQIAMAPAGSLSLANVELDGSLINSGVYTPTLGDTYYIIVGAGSTSGTLAFTNQQAPDAFSSGLNTITFGGQEFAISFSAAYNHGVGSQFSGAGNDVALMAIPEPNSLAMLAGSFGLALGLQRFRRRRK